MLSKITMAVLAMALLVSAIASPALAQRASQQSAQGGTTVATHCPTGIGPTAGDIRPPIAPRRRGAKSPGGALQKNPFMTTAERAAALRSAGGRGGSAGAAVISIRAARSHSTTAAPDAPRSRRSRRGGCRRVI